MRTSLGLGFSVPWTTVVRGRGCRIEREGQTEADKLTCYPHINKASQKWLNPWNFCPLTTYVLYLIICERQPRVVRSYEVG